MPLLLTLPHDKLLARLSSFTNLRFGSMRGRKNPYVSRLKKQVTIRLGEDVIAYFKQMADETGIPYQSLINLYLRDCAAHQRRLAMNWF